MKVLVEETKTDPPVEPPNERGSSALVDYFWASQCDLKLFHFVIETVLSVDYTGYVASRALEGFDLNRDLSPGDLAQSEPGPRTKTLRRLSQELLEMFIGRAVDNFQCFLVQSIHEVLRTKPEILSARTQELTVGHILQFDSIEALVTDIIEQKVASLSFQGFADLQDWCEVKGIPLLVPQGDRPDVIELIALRNVIVHNRGRVDAKYLKAVPNSEYNLGEKRKIEVDGFFRSLDLLNRIVNVTDAAVVGKFKLKRLFTTPELTARERERFAPSSSKEGLDEGAVGSDEGSNTPEEDSEVG